jgi:hypothetical protein
MSADEEVQKAPQSKRDYTRNCPECDGRISIKAKICPICGSALSFWRRLVEYSQALSFVASIIVLLFLTCSVCQTNTSINIAKNGIEQNQQAILLTQKSVDQVDSSLALTNIAIQLQKEANQLNRDEFLISSNDFKNKSKLLSIEKRPVLCITKCESKINGESMLVYTTVLNAGANIASNISAIVQIRDIKRKLELLSDTTFLIAIQPNGLNTLKQMTQKSDFFAIKISLRWSWDYNDSTYTDTIYEFCEPVKSANAYLLDIKQAQQYWK